MHRKTKSEERSMYPWPVYHQGRWVSILLKYLPKDAIVDYNRIKRYGFDSLDPATSFPQKERRNCNTAISALQSTITEIIEPEELSDRKLRQLCIYNDIPMQWVTDRFLKTASTSPNLNEVNRTDRKYICLGKRDFTRFLRALRLINERAALIAEIVWWLNWHAVEMGDYVPLEAVLKLKIEAIAPEQGEGAWIELRYECRGRSHLLVHWLPEYLWERVRGQIRSGSWMLFPNRNGAPLLTGDLDKIFARAGVKARIKGRVTSLSLRPEAKGSRQDSVLSKRLFLPTDVNLNEVTESEWKLIIKCIPSIVQRRGRKAQNDPRCVFNDILSCLREGCPLHRLPELIPTKKHTSEDALESQFRRWRKSGVFWQIHAVRMLLND